MSQLATSRRWQTNFLDVLPAVNRHAKNRFRRLNPALREEATAEAQARGSLTYATLVRQHKLHQVYTGNLATRL